MHLFHDHKFNNNCRFNRTNNFIKGKKTTKKMALTCSGIIFKEKGGRQRKEMLVKKLLE